MCAATRFDLLTVGQLKICRVGKIRLCKKCREKQLNLFYDNLVHLQKIKMFNRATTLKQNCWLCKCSGLMYANENKLDVSNCKNNKNKALYLILLHFEHTL